MRVSNGSHWLSWCRKLLSEIWRSDLLLLLVITCLVSKELVVLVDFDGSLLLIDWIHQREQFPIVTLDHLSDGLIEKVARVECFPLVLHVASMIGSSLA